MDHEKVWRDVPTLTELIKEPLWVRSGGRDTAIEMGLHALLDLHARLGAVEKQKAPVAALDAASERSTIVELLYRLREAWGTKKNDAAHDAAGACIRQCAMDPTKEELVKEHQMAALHEFARGGCAALVEVLEAIERGDHRTRLGAVEKQKAEPAEVSAEPPIRATDGPTPEQEQLARCATCEARGRAAEGEWCDMFARMPRWRCDRSPPVPDEPATAAPADPIVHDLKCEPPYFEAIIDGSKRFELRRNNRHFAPGDVLRLREWGPEGYTGREQSVRVLLCMYGPERFGLVPGFCAMSIEPMDSGTAGAGEVPPEPALVSSAFVVSAADRWRQTCSEQPGAWSWLPGMMEGSGPGRVAAVQLRELGKTTVVLAGEVAVPPATEPAAAVGPEVERLRADLAASRSDVEEWRGHFEQEFRMVKTQTAKADQLRRDRDAALAEVERLRAEDAAKVAAERASAVAWLRAEALANAADAGRSGSGSAIVASNVLNNAATVVERGAHHEPR